MKSPDFFVFFIEQLFLIFNQMLSIQAFGWHVICESTVKFLLNDSETLMQIFIFIFFKRLQLIGSLKKITRQTYNCMMDIP